MRSALLKQHGASPEEGLKIHSLFEFLRKKLLENPNYLTNLLEKHLLNNPHFVRVLLEPNKEMEAQQLTAERAKLDKVKENLSASEIQKIIDDAEELSKFQKFQEEVDLDVLPKLTLKDVSPVIRSYELNKETIGSFNVYHHACFTNEIIYADLFFNLPYLKEDELTYARLFTVLLAQMGCADRNYAQNLEFIQANTGGISTHLSLNIQAGDSNKMIPSLSLRAKALHRKLPLLFKLLKETSTSVDFKDHSRLKEVIQKHFTGLESSLNQNSLRYALNLSSSGLSHPSHIANAWYGLDYYWKIKEIAQNFDEHKEELIKNLIEMKHRLLNVENPDIVLSCDAAAYNEIKGNQFYGLLDIPLKSPSPWESHFKLKSLPSQGRVIQSPVAFIGKVFNTVPYTNKYSPALSIAGHLFDNLTLHSSIREQGGAYGGGASSNAISGNFYFYSYRDPNIVSSLQAFEASINRIIKGNFDEEDLTEAKLEMIQAMDAPVSPGSRADLAYVWLKEGKTAEIRQAFRNKLLSLTKKDVIEAVRSEILPKWKNGATVVFAGQELLEKENAVLQESYQQPLKIERV